jgi:hypothetical protein
MICQHCGATIPENSNFCTYCSTAVAQQYEAKPQHIVSRKLDLDKLLGDTLTLYVRHFGIMCVIGLIYAGISVIFEVGGIVTEMPELFNILGMPVLCYLFIWIIRQCLYTARGGTGLQWNLMLPSFGMFLKILAIGCVIVFSAAVGTLPAASLVFGLYVMDDLPIAVKVIVFVAIVGAALLPCYIATRLWLAQYFLVDRNMGIIDSIDSAWQASSGNFWKLFVSIIAFFVCLFCGALVLGVPAVIFAGNDPVWEAILIHVALAPFFPIVIFGLGLAYLQLTEHSHNFDRENESEEAAKTEDW